MFLEGYIACSGGYMLSDNPYPANSTEWSEWRRGWYSCYHESRYEYEESYNDFS